SSSCTYLSKWGRRKTSFSSAAVADEISTVPCYSAKSNACRGAERGSSAALTATWVSTTTRTLLVIQQRLQDLWRQATCLSTGTDLVHDGLERLLLSSREIL